MRVITETQLTKIAEFTREFTDKTFLYQVGGDIGYGARYYCDGQSFYGQSGGRTLYAAHMIGYALGWARKSGKSIPDEMRELMTEVQCNYARRYEAKANDQELSGRASAEHNWECHYVLTVTNREGIVFKAVLYKDDPAGYQLALGLWTVKVYDTRYPFSDYGQFTGGSAYVVTLLGLDSFGSGLGWDGWDLDGGVDAWKLSGSNAINIRAWLNHCIDRAGLKLPQDLPAGH